jgi:hypothetical protein
VFCAAILLYEMVAGRRLFAAETKYLQLKAIAESDATRPSEHDPSFPRALEAVVMKGLRRDRRERYQTALEMQRDLMAFARDGQLDLSQYRLAQVMEGLFAEDMQAWQAAKLAGQSLVQHVVARRTASMQVITAMESPRPSQRGRRRWPLVGGAAVVVGLAAMGAWALRTSVDGPVSPTRAEQATPVGHAPPTPPATELDAMILAVPPTAITPDTGSPRSAETSAPTRSRKRTRAPARVAAPTPEASGQRALDPDEPLR